MACENCAITVSADRGKMRVKLHYDNMIQLCIKNEYLDTIYYCPVCKAYWESRELFTKAVEVSKNYVKKEYGDLLQNFFESILIALKDLGLLI